MARMTEIRLAEFCVVPVFFALHRFATYINRTSTPYDFLPDFGDSLWAVVFDFALNAQGWVMRRGQSAPAVRALPTPIRAIQCPFPLDIVIHRGQGDFKADSALFYLSFTIASSPSSYGKLALATGPACRTSLIPIMYSAGEQAGDEQGRLERQDDV